MQAPVIGNLHLLVASLPHVSLRDLTAKHGSDGLMLLLLGSVPSPDSRLPTPIMSSPRAVRAVLRTHDHIFMSRPGSPSWC